MYFIRVGKITGDSALIDEGKGILRAFMGNVTANPIIGLNFLSVLDYLDSPEIVATFAGPKNTREERDMLHALHKHFISGLVIRIAAEAEIPVPAGAEQKAVVQICAAGTCGLPVTTVAELEAALDEID
mgnify:FL=1